MHFARGDLLTFRDDTACKVDGISAFRRLWLYIALPVLVIDMGEAGLAYMPGPTG